MTETHGATFLGEGRTLFRVWAPNADKVEVVLVAPEERRALLEPSERGYHAAVLDGVGPGARYRLSLDGGEQRADPASRSQPEGVHGPSEVTDPSYPWTDEGFTNPALCDYVIYELHVGTCSDTGTFEGAIGHLDDLRDLGVTAVEIMPVAQFPGARNWGYDGVFPSAVQDTYGGPAGLKRFVDACHRRGLAVVLDVVYNHLGPEGAPHDAFGPYFSERYRTPWGPSLNVDDAGSDEVRRYFIDSALRWFEEFHVDALRLDAIHGIVDTSAYPFLRQLGVEARALATRLGRPLYLIAESDLNDPRVVTPPEHGGLGLDAMWSDDFHHALHALLTGETDGYYADFGSTADLAAAYANGFVYDGRYSAYRGRSHGAPARGLPRECFVVCAQNHDQVGNRMLGERFGALLDHEGRKLAAGALLLAPYVPLLFMGEEYGERAPFLYFVSHTDPDLIEAVRTGRREEFAGFGWAGEAPDPQDDGTFRRSRLDRSLLEQREHRALRDLYAELIRLRPSICGSASDLIATAGAAWVELRQRDTFAVLNFGEGTMQARADAGEPWQVLIDSADARWAGPGATTGEQLDGGAPFEVAPRAFVLMRRGG